MTKDSGCRACRAGTKLDFDFTMAFQPILDLADDSVWAYEALVRGPNGESAYTILDQVTDETRYQFDQAARDRFIGHFNFALWQGFDAIAQALSQVRYIIAGDFSAEVVDFYGEQRV